MTTTIKRCSHACLGLAAVSLAALSGPAARAQSVAAADNGAPQLAEIIVTATKHATSLQSTPMAITAVSGNDLQNRGITDFSSLAASVPSASMKSNGPGQTEFEMRGMTSSGGNSPTVGFYLDDIPLTAPAAAQNGKVVIDPSLYDLSRVEVLRGPQGTLYGSGSMGGTVRLITNEPDTRQLQASAETTLSGTGSGGGFNHAENLMFNLPVTDRLALRVVGSESFTSGWIHRIVVDPFPQPSNGGNALAPGQVSTRGDVLSAPVVADDPHSNDMRLDGVRATLKWRPIDDLTITPFVFYQKITQNGPSAYDSVPGNTNAHYEPFLIPEPYVDRVDVYSVTIDYSLPAFDLKSITAKWYRNSTMTQDGSENFENGADGFPNTGTFYGPNGTGPVSGIEIDPSQQLSQEVRLSSSAPSRVQWVAGVFYSDFRSDWELDTNVTNPAAFFQTIDNVWTLSQQTKIDQYALYGDLTYRITSKLKADVGIRGYKYTNDFLMNFAGFGSPSGTTVPTITPVHQSNSGATPKLDLSYQATPNQMYYLTSARGFRPGGGNQPLPLDTSFGPFIQPFLVQEGFPKGAPISYGPDSVWSYEGGGKIKLFDERAVVDAALYYEDWRNIQLEELPGDYPLFVNAGAAHIKGAEIELTALLGHGWQVAAGGSDTEAALASSVHGFLAGQQLPDVPKYSGNVRVSYAHELGGGGATVEGLLETVYTGARVDTTFPNSGVDTQTHLSPYALTNLRIGLDWNDFDATLFASNLFNKRAMLENLTELTLANSAFNRVETNQPLTVGVDLSYHFH